MPSFSSQSAICCIAAPAVPSSIKLTRIMSLSHPPSDCSGVNKSAELVVEAGRDTALEPTVPRTQIELRIALDLLKNARDRVRRAQCPRTLRKIRSAIKSAEGAARRLQLRHAAGERR
jgi:hypothetical protein